jgi:hypothetical protein
MVRGSVEEEDGGDDPADPANSDSNATDVSLIATLIQQRAVEPAASK